MITETYISHDQIHPIRNNWLGSVFFFPRDSHTKGVIVLLHMSLEGITDVDTDAKERFVFFKVTASNERVLCVCAPFGHSSREHLTRVRFFEGLHELYEK